MAIGHLRAPWGAGQGIERTPTAIVMDWDGMWWGWSGEGEVEVLRESSEQRRQAQIARAMHRAGFHRDRVESRTSSPTLLVVFCPRIVLASVSCRKRSSCPVVPEYPIKMWVLDWSVSLKCTQV